MNYGFASLLACLFTMPSFAGPRGEPGIDRAKCDFAAVRACVQGHQEALRLVRIWLEANERVIAENSARIDQLRRAIAPAEAERARISVEISATEQELSFLRSSARKTLDAIEGYLSLEDLFHMPTLRRAWHERYPAEREAKLRNHLLTLRRNDSEQKALLDRVTPTYEAVRSEFQSAIAQKNKWLAQVTEHEAMCGFGCKNDLCPVGN